MIGEVKLALSIGLLVVIYDALPEQCNHILTYC